MRVGDSVMVNATVLDGDPHRSATTVTRRIAATVIFVHPSRNWFVAEWTAAGGAKRRESFYTGARAGRET